MEIQRNPYRFVSTLIAAALAFGVAGDALAQNGTGTVGGTTTDDTSAGNIHQTGMPQTQTQGDVSFVSGGVGLDESTALRRAQRQWPLSLRFTGPGSEYVSDVHVQIVDGSGATVLDATSQGPYMLVRLRPGRYTVHVSHGSTDRSQAVTVHGNGSARAAFVFPSSQ